MSMLGAIAAATLAVQAAPAIPAEGTLVEVVAEGRTTRTPDMAVISAGVVTQAATAQAAMQDNAARMTRVIAALKAAGIAERDVQTSNIGLNPQYRYEQNQAPVLTGYQASNQVTVRFRDLARAGSILDALVREGANSINGPTLTLAEPEAAMDEARTDAVKRARARAELYARALGMRVDRVVSLSEGGGGNPNPMPMMRMQAVEASDTPIAPGEQAVTVNVSVRFLLR